MAVTQAKEKVVRPARGRKLGEQLAERVEEEIIASGWPVGKVLGSEAELIERYGVSRAVFREAMRIVDHHGVAEMRRGPGGGLVVGSNGITPAFPSSGKLRGNGGSVDIDVSSFVVTAGDGAVAVLAQSIGGGGGLVGGISGVDIGQGTRSNPATQRQTAPPSIHACHGSSPVTAIHAPTGASPSDAPSHR